VVSLVLVAGAACTPNIWRLAPGPLCRRSLLLEWPRRSLPDFERIEQVGDWLGSELQRRGCEQVVAHSMAGLAALDAVNRGRCTIHSLILVETYFCEPAAMFRQLVHAADGSELEASIRQMLERERSHYHPRLLAWLKAPLWDRGRLAALPAGRLQLIHGDRGESRRSAVLKALGLTAWKQAESCVHLVPDAAHFPMLEQPGPFYALVDRLLTAAEGGGSAAPS
jgi:pimeloyl-ACP methyl ester carboxylesterase